MKCQTKPTEAVAKKVAAPKIVSFLTAGSGEKDTVIGASWKNFDHFDFVTALVTLSQEQWS